ncbi:MAG: glycosyltransferase family 2 protein [Acidimicrobiia bacterium]
MPGPEPEPERPERPQRPEHTMPTGTATPTTRWPLVDVVVLGWRAGAQTASCLRSVLDAGYPAVRLVVVDNGSDDGSDELVWKELLAHLPDAARIDCGGARSDGGLVQRAAADAGIAPQGIASQGDDLQPSAFFIRSSRNRGYSAGMNLALELLAYLGPAEYFWLLNNDITVRPGAIEALVRRCRDDESIALCGCLQHLVDPAGRSVGTIPGGFRYHPFFGFPQSLHCSGTSLEDRARIERRMFGVHGAAVFGTRRFLEQVGPLGTDRFIYYEEQDWATRARRHGFTLGWAPDAVVDHAHASSMQAVADGERSAMSRYLSSRARIVYTKRWHRGALPTVLLAQLVHILNDARASRQVAVSSLRGCVDGLLGRHHRFASMGDALLPPSRHNSSD